MSDIVFGKYQLIAELGRGGMADVFLAVTTSPIGLGFSKLVVIKRIREQLAQDPEFMAMLVDEARIAARLNHPNVIQAIDIGESGGEYFLAMEYLDGQPLHRIRNRARTLLSSMPARLQYNILVDVLAGLHHAHQLLDYDGSPLEVVHRDVTPHNVFVTYSGQVKVVDFGIAKAVGRTTETEHGIIKGKAAYMAPEQAAAQSVDRRADIFSVGVMLWEAAVGDRMWVNPRDDQGIIRRLIRGQYQPSARAARPDVPKAIDDMCRRALAQEPSGRFSTAAEFEAELSRFLEETREGTTDRELGSFVSDAFKEERRETQRIIEEQLSHLASKSTVPLVRFGPDSGPLSASGGSFSQSFESLPSSARHHDPAAPTLVSASVDPVGAPVVSPRRSKARGLLAIGAVAVSVAAWALVSHYRGQAARAHAADAQGTITLTLRARPPETRFSVDDGPVLDNNPYSAAWARDTATHRIRAMAPGYVPITETATFSDDISLRLELAPERPPSEPVDTGPPPAPHASSLPPPPTSRSPKHDRR